MHKGRCSRGSTIQQGGATSKLAMAPFHIRRLPADNPARLPESISLDLGALMEPMGVAMHARNRASLAPSSNVLVLGAGAVGLLTAAVAKASKAKAVVICDIQKDRVDFAVANGFADAGFVVPMMRPETTEEKLVFSKEVATLASSVVVGSGVLGEVDVTFECTGVESCVQSAIYVSRRTSNPVPVVTSFAFMKIYTLTLT
jgi:L-iditol 2-dehydrogenase